jgi:hypothetical protein
VRGVDSAWEQEKVISDLRSGTRRFGGALRLSTSFFTGILAKGLFSA